MRVTRGNGMVERNIISSGIRIIDNKIKIINIMEPVHVLISFVIMKIHSRVKSKLLPKKPGALRW
jgi:hypothetical protein